MRTVESRIGHEVLGRPEGLRLLASHPFGRVAVVVNGCPMIFPVNHHVVDGDTIVFRSEEVSQLTDSRCAISMSLEADGIDDDGRMWSVTITGAGRDIVPAERARLHELGLESSAASHETPWIQIRPETVTGRRFGWFEW